MSKRYSAIAIGLHWAIAFLLLGNIFLGWNMFTNEHVPIENRFQLHKSIGITVLILSVTRVLWRMFNPAPKLPDDMAGYEKTLSHFVHGLFYFAMIAIPLSGWALVSASNFSVATVLYGVIPWPHLPFLPELSVDAKTSLAVPVEFFHSKFSWVVLGLTAAHVLGALKHQFAGEEGVLKRMIPFLGQTAAPTKSKGALITFAGATLLFLGITFGPSLLSGAPKSVNEETLELAAIIPNWTVDYDQSHIEFSGIHDGNTFNGRFLKWSTDISFDPSLLTSSKVSVSIDATSASTGKLLYDNTLKAGEWFDTSNFPVIRVELNNFQETGGTFTADAAISLKDLVATIPFEFELDDTSGTTTMTGRAILPRSSFNLGQQSDSAGDWVSLEIDIDVKVVASPAG